MKIEQSTFNDIEEIFRLYRLATKFQKSKLEVFWPDFERKMVEKEIEEMRQFKLTENDKIACVWAIAFQDPLIWQERDADRAIYIHRIATNPEFRGRGLVSKITDRAVEYANRNEIDYIRMDTVGENRGLIAYYEKCGFTFLGLYELEDSEGLPAHYDKATVSLFEIAVRQPNVSTTDNALK